MQCDDILDRALHDLGMLATCTNSRQEYLREIHNNRQILNMLTINTRYVNNVSIGFRMRPVAPHVRYKPYSSTTRREERQRTRSENNDKDVTCLVRAIVEEEVLEKGVEELNQLKKAKSLENIVVLEKANGEGGVNIGNCSELEVVSKSIQKLKVVE